MNYFVSFSLLICAGLCLGNSVSYKDYTVYRLTPRTQDALDYLKQLEQYSDVYSLWNQVRNVGNSVDVMVPPTHIKEFEHLIQTYEIDMTVFISNVQDLIDSEGFRPSGRAAGIDWKNYYTGDEINDWLKTLADQNPDKVKLIVGGKSYEGRDIVGVHVSYSPSNEKKAVFLEGNIHAREWISSAVVTYILNELLTSTDPNVRSLAESYDWYVFPIVNPDGLAYTHDGDRLWRKTRVPYGRCYGADPNRNWGYHFNDGGTSNDPCSETYHGAGAFSEPCTKTLSEFISTIGENLVGYIGFHSYSQLLLIPYGHSPAHVENFDELNEIGLKAAKSLAQRYGTQYTVGNIVETIYVASGGSMDWVKGTFHTPVTYTYELRDTGRYGFILPATQIIPTGEETLDSLVTMFQEYEKLHS